MTFSRLSLGCLTALLAAVSAAASANTGASESAHAFYYSWYRNPAVDGAWAHWNHNVILRDGSGPNFSPPESIGANFYPAAGLYSSNDPEDVLRQMLEIKRAGAGVAAVTWWGRGHPTNESLPVAFDAAEKAGIKVCIHLEPFPGRNAESTREALVYLLDTYGAHPALYRHGGLPMVYLYDSYLTPAEEWAAVFTPEGAKTLRGTPHDWRVIGLWVKKNDGPALKRAGFDGFYTYFATDGFTYGSTAKNWPELAAFAREQGMLFIPSVGPGYDDTRIRPWNGVNRRDREGGDYYDRMFRAAIAVKPDIISITSYNEWHEGTQIEPSIPKKIEGYTYGDFSPREPGWYLDRTRHWVEIWQTGQAVMERGGAEDAE